MGDFSKKVTAKNADGALNETFTNSAERGVVSQLDYFDHDITNEASVNGYYVVHPNDFVYNPRISTTAPCGPINRNRLNRAGVMSPLYTVFSIDDSVYKTYLEHYFKTSRWHDFMFLEGNSGARSDRFSISDSMFFEMPIWCPSLAEQEAIAQQLELTDSLITLHQRKCQYRGLYGYLSWEQRKLGELCTISKGHGYSKADIRDVGTPLILYGRLYTQYESRIENVDTFAVEQEGSLLSKGNEVIVPASGETAEDIAVASSVRRSGIIFGGDLNVVTPVSKLDPDYIALAITYSKAHDDLAKRAQGKSVVHVHGNDIAEVEIPYPSESEQKRVSTVVLSLDSLITLHQRQSNGKAHNIIILSRTKNRQLDIAKSAVLGLETRGNSRKLLNEHPIQQRFLDIP